VSIIISSELDAFILSLLWYWFLKYHIQ
jgi:hypothetical protein